MQLSIKTQAGASLIEIIMVVALMALITIAALTYYNSANEASKVNQAVSDITALSSTIRATFASQGNYADLTEALIFDMKSVNSNMKSPVGTKQLKHGWSQEANAIEIAVSGTGNNSFSITYGALPVEACQEIASRLLGRFDSVAVGAGASPTAVTGIAGVMTGCATGSATSSDKTVRVTQR